MHVQCSTVKKKTLFTWIFGWPWYPLDIQAALGPFLNQSFSTSAYLSSCLISAMHKRPDSPGTVLKAVKYNSKCFSFLKNSSFSLESVMLVNFFVSFPLWKWLVHLLNTLGETVTRYIQFTLLPLGSHGLLMITLTDTETKHIEDQNVDTRILRAWKYKDKNSIPT